MYPPQDPISVPEAEGGSRLPLKSVFSTNNDDTRTLSEPPGTPVYVRTVVIQKACLHHAARLWRPILSVSSRRTSTLHSTIPVASLFNREHPKAEVSASWQAGAHSKRACLDDGLPRFSYCCSHWCWCWCWWWRMMTQPARAPSHVRRSSQSGSAPILKHLPNHLTHRAPCRPLWFQDLEEAVSRRMTCRANAGKRKKRGDPFGQPGPRPKPARPVTYTYTWGD